MPPLHENCCPDSPGFSVAFHNILQPSKSVLGPPFKHYFLFLLENWRLQNAFGGLGDSVSGLPDPWQGSRGWFGGMPPQGPCHSLDMHQLREERGREAQKRGSRSALLITSLPSIPPVQFHSLSPSLPRPHCGNWRCRNW